MAYNRYQRKSIKLHDRPGLLKWPCWLRSMQAHPCCHSSWSLAYILEVLAPDIFCCTVSAVVPDAEFSLDQGLYSLYARSRLANRTVCFRTRRLCILLCE
ncbi:hypothetical protein BJV82DRAFT_617513 [Fennellomyces sp. T-0311]|nr:hypothetical protein BJV82DRAFT_617513 [Fennellomyces sp. T-0311]